QLSVYRLTLFYLCTLSRYSMCTMCSKSVIIPLMNYELKTPQDIETMREAAQISVKILETLRDAVKPGVSTQDLDDIVVEQCAIYEVEPAFIGVVQSAGPFPANVCVSIMILCCMLSPVVTM